jgi:hypothetical protein
MYLHAYEYSMGLRLCFYGLGRCRFTSYGLSSLHAAAMEQYGSMYSRTVVSSVSSAFAHDWDIDVIIVKTFRSGTYMTVPSFDTEIDQCVVGHSLTHASLGRPVTNVPAQPTQHFSGLNTDCLAKRWCLLLWRLIGDCQNVSHW